MFLLTPIIQYLSIIFLKTKKIFKEILLFRGKGNKGFFFKIKLQTCFVFCNQYFLLLFFRLTSKQSILPIYILSCNISEDNTDVVPLTRRNFLDLRHSGVYLIYNNNKDMYYYGESVYILNRFNHHFRNLDQQTHDNKPLQEDYTKNPEHFQFLVLDHGPEWNDLEKRVSRQDYYIELKKDKSYNIFQSEPIVTRPVLINGKRFEAIRQAVRPTGIPRSSLKRLLRDPSKPEYKIFEGDEYSYGKTPIFAQKKGTLSLLFEGIVDAVAESHVVKRGRFCSYKTKCNT